MSDFVFEWNEEKDFLLKEKYGISFEDIINSINSGKILNDEPHFNQKNYSHQRLLIVELNKYVYVVPYITDQERSVIFLKTIYPSRKYTKIYLAN